MPPSPFLKWAGGKRQLLAYIEARVPERIDTYFEPFLGGAAVFFRLAAQGRFRRAVLADANPDLVGCYQAVRGDVAGVIAALRKYRNDRDQYYRVRAQDPDQMSPVERAARVIYLNRCGYNGLYRVNSKGRFNVPFGRYKQPVICDDDKLRAASLALRKAKLVCGDFTRVLGKVVPGDFVYFDPPYVPLSATSSFTGCASSGPGIRNGWPARYARWLCGRSRRCCRTLTAGRPETSTVASISTRSRPDVRSTPSRAGAVRSMRSWCAASTTRCLARRRDYVE
jgi:DNA adenine methylase